jgi:hypothetical protein
MGASVRPNHHQAVWFQEGIAVLAETAPEGTATPPPLRVRTAVMKLR